MFGDMLHMQERSARGGARHRPSVLSWLLRHVGTVHVWGLCFGMFEVRRGSAIGVSSNRQSIERHAVVPVDQRRQEGWLRVEGARGGEPTLHVCPNYGVCHLSGRQKNLQKP